MQEILRDAAAGSPEAIAACLGSNDAGLAPHLSIGAGLEQALFEQARHLTMERFGRKVHLFAPLYVSNLCVNHCLYCGFRQENTLLGRRVLSRKELQAEAEALAAMGHRTVLIVAGEHPVHAGPGAIAQDIAAVLAVPPIREVRVEVMPMNVAGYRQLYEAGARTVVLYQETYDRALYAQAHPTGPKANYAWRLGALDRAIEAGFRKVGMGILVGLGEAAQEAAALVAHARSIQARFGIWPATVSLPRLQPAAEAPWSVHPPHPVDDPTFLRLIAFMRLALPEVGIVLSTREGAAVRDRLLELGIGITQVSAGSKTGVGGYTLQDGDRQFEIQDERPVSAVVERLRGFGYEPVSAEGEADRTPLQEAQRNLLSASAALEGS